MAGVITEIAIECGVSEQAVRAWCRRNHVAKDAKGSFAISESQKTAIYQHYLGVERKQVSQQAKASCETCETTLIAMLQGELDRKSEQLAVKDKQIEELNARLAEVSSALVTAQQTAAAAQALHAGTMHQQLLSGKSGADQPDRHAEQLTKLLFKHKKYLPLYHLDLIPYNQTTVTETMVPSSHTRIKAFCRIIHNAGISVNIRTQFGSDINAACGQLAGAYRDDQKQGERTMSARDVKSFGEEVEASC